MRHTHQKVMSIRHPDHGGRERMKMRINQSVQLGGFVFIIHGHPFHQIMETQWGTMMLASIVIIVLFRQQPWGRVVKLGLGLLMITLIFSFSLFLSK